MKRKNTGKQYKMNVGDNILYWRKIKGIKQEELAKKIDISAVALSNIENGVSKPDVERIQDIADALELEVQQLFTNPLQMITQNNTLQGNGVIHSNNSQPGFDKALIERMMLLMERMSDYFIRKDQKAQ